MSAGALSLQALSRRVLDTRHGLFRGLGETPRARHGGDIFIMGGEIVDPNYFRRLDRSRQKPSSQVAGAGLTRAEALWSTIGEGIERYSAQIAGERRIASCEALGAAAVDPRDFLFYSEAQYACPDFPYKRFAPDAAYSWAHARNMRSGAACFAPLQMAALGAERQEGETPLCQPISTGIAAHVHAESALLTGFLEVIERDAFMATWLLRRPPPRIAVEQTLLDALDPRVAALVRRNDLMISLYLISTDNDVPVVLCAIRRNAPAAMVVGAAARLCLRDAIAKAVIEAYHTWAWGLTLERKPAVAAEEIVEFGQHVRHYFEPDHQHAAGFLDDGAVVRYGDLRTHGPQALDDLVGALTARGHGVFSVDLTSPDVAELGFVVFRTMISGMHPLACGVRHYPLDDRRLKVVAAAWDFAMPATLNRDPHPFP